MLWLYYHPVTVMKLDEIIKTSLLYDFYGELLPKRQRQTMELYYGENLSLGEIADEFGISRQAVSDALRNAGKSLGEYESKLGLVGRLGETTRAVSEIDDIIDKVIAGLRGEDGDISPKEAADKLEEVRSIIDKLEE